MSGAGCRTAGRRRLHRAGAPEPESRGQLGRIQMQGAGEGCWAQEVARAQERDVQSLHLFGDLGRVQCSWDTGR